MEQVTIEDVKLFLKKYLKLIILITLITSILGTALISYRQISQSISDDVTETEQEKNDNEIEVRELLETRPEELTVVQEEKVRNHLSEGVYYFRVYIENPDYTPFSRPHLFEEAILKNDTIELVNEQTAFSFSIYPRYIIHSTYNSDTMIYTLAFTTGNYSDSKMLADTYYSIITNQELDILNDRRVYVFDQPRLLNTDDIPDNEDLNLVTTETKEPTLLMTILVSLVVSGVFGLIFGLVFAYLKEKKSQKIGPLYNYGLNNTDTIIEVDSHAASSTQYIEQLTNRFIKQGNIMLADPTVDLSSQALQTDQLEAHLATDILDVEPHSINQEVIILVFVNETKKQWFREQYYYLEGYGVATKLVRIY